MNVTKIQCKCSMKRNIYKHLSLQLVCKQELWLPVLWMISKIRQIRRRRGAFLDLCTGLNSKRLTGASRPNHKSKPFKASKNTSRNRLKKNKKQKTSARFLFLFTFWAERSGSERIVLPPQTLLHYL